MISGDARNNAITQLWRNTTPVSNAPPAAPDGLSLSLAGPYVVLNWDAASDTETPADGLTYNVRVGASPAGTDALAPMSLASGRRLLPQDGTFSVEFTTNLADWLFLGPATPRYLFTDTNAPAQPQRHYRLRWP